jgi:DNA polymerase III delta subunit
LWYEGEPDARTSFAKNLDKLPKGTVKHFTAPSDFKAEGEAATFLVREMQSHGYTLEASLAQAMVERAGTDLGVLSYEALKLSTLLRADGLDTPTPQLVGQTLASLGDTTSIQFLDALRTRNAKQVARTLTRIRRMAPNGSGAVKEMVGRTLTTLILTLQAADFYERGKEAKDAAALVGQNPWYYENKILPFAQTWGRQRLRELVRHFCIADRSVLFGVVDPWIAFEIGVLRLVVQ